MSRSTIIKVVVRVTVPVVRVSLGHTYYLANLG